MKFHVKNLVSVESKMIIEQELTKLGIDYFTIMDGEVELEAPVSDLILNTLKEKLAIYNLYLQQDKKSQLIERIKNSIIEMVREADKPLKTNFSNYLSSRLMYDYTYMANVFSKVQGVTIERFIILSKIERVKELLSLGQLTLTEISYKLHYSSVGHLSNQFKKITGFTPSNFKQSENK